jgi:hypothetical protein
MTVTLDVVFLGRPADAAQARRWQAEVDLVAASGRRVRVALTPDDMAAPADAGLVLVADGGLAGRLHGLPPDAQVVVRRAGGETPALVRSLSARLGRRVVAAPLGPDERQAWARDMPERWMTAADWPPLVDGAALALAAHRPVGNRWRVAIAADPPAGIAADDLAAALAASGLGPDAVEVAAAGPHDPRRPPHVLLCAAPPDPDTLALAVEDGCLVAVAQGPGKPRTGPVLSWDWDTLPATLAALLASPVPWRDAVLAVARVALDTQSDAAFLARLEDGTCGPALKPPRAPDLGAGPARDRPPEAAARTRTVEADIALIADFRRRDEVTEQAAAQVRAHAAAARRVLLVQAWNGKPGGDIHPVIDALVRLGQAQVLPPWASARVTCAQVLLPRLTIPALGLLRPAIDADCWIVVETETDQPRWDAAALNMALARLSGTQPHWLAGHPAARDHLAAHLPGPVGLWPMPLPVAAPDPAPEEARPDPSAARPVIGIVAYSPPEAEAALLAVGAPPGAEVHVLLAGHQRTLKLAPAPHVRVLALDGHEIDGFVRLIDVLVVSPTAPFEALPRLAIGLALARGVAVVARPGLAPTLGRGPRYGAPADWPALLADILRGPPRVARAPRALVPDDTPMAAVMGLRRLAAPPQAAGRSRRILFATANGVGLGHVTRLSAIARRLPDGVEPVFATMSQAVGVLRDMGFAAELLTGYGGKPGDAWRVSLYRRMTELLDHHRPSALVLDSSNPYPGLVEAAISRPDTRLIWVRRGMWRASQDHSEFLGRAPYFERVIEPQDIAEADETTGADLSGHGRVVRVPPIGLLDDDDLLDQTAARRALGLPETPPPGGSVLVQLGSGTTRDLNTLLTEVIAQLRRFDGLEIVLAQWLNAPTAYDARWPGVRLLSGYPIPRYYRAFDFTISAAGYNSYNDLLRFGIPTIFIANDAQVMDDQGARARFAEQAEAAFNVPETDLGALSDCVAAILQPQVRGFLQDRARAIALPNGAAEAARAVMEVA